jgi:NADPH-dependent glutamate synthase beta subunit-like oxidoreductase
MGISNEDSKGVIDAVNFLRTIHLGGEIEIGEKVVVIGGGNAAVDGARSALRKGAKQVSILYRRTRSEMPADSEEIESALEEGIDIQFLTAPIEVIASKGRMTGIKCIRMELGDLDSSGRRRPVPVKGSEFKMDVDTMIYAISQEPDISFLKDSDPIQHTKWNTVITDPETMQTHSEDVFAGGDVVRGPATVTEAMGDGKTAAQMIKQYLQNEPVQIECKVIRPSVSVVPLELSNDEIEELLEAKRSKLSVLPVSEREGNFKEVAFSLEEEKAVKEAKRCLRCDLEIKAEER